MHDFGGWVCRMGGLFALAILLSVVVQRADAQDAVRLDPGNSLIQSTAQVDIDRSVHRKRTGDMIRESWLFKGNGKVGLMHHLVATNLTVFSADSATEEMWTVVVDQLNRVGIDDATYETYQGMRYKLISGTYLGSCIAAALVFNKEALPYEVEGNIAAGPDAAVVFLCQRGSGFPVEVRDYLTGLRRDGIEVFVFPPEFGPLA